MANETLTPEVLSELLRQAEAAHAEYESTLGHRDENWAAWYATFILREIQSQQEAKGDKLV